MAWFSLWLLRISNTTIKHGRFSSYHCPEKCTYMVWARMLSNLCPLWNSPSVCLPLVHRCAIPARINQYQYLILKNQVSIPISISIFQIFEIDTNFNINTPDLENQYKYQYQYLSFKNSITIPIPILKILQFNLNLGLKTKVLQYSECKNF